MNEKRKHDAYFYQTMGFDGEGVQMLINFINQNEGRLLVGIQSSGGRSGISQMVLKILNDNAERITLCAVSGVYSAAFEVFKGFQGQKAMTDNTLGMAHYGKNDFNLHTNGRPVYFEDEAVLLQNKKAAPKEVAKAESYMTPSELRRFKKGDEVYFSFDRMKELFPNAEIIEW